MHILRAPNLENWQPKYIFLKFIYAPPKKVNSRDERVQHYLYLYLYLLTIWIICICIRTRTGRGLTRKWAGLS